MEAMYLELHSAALSPNRQRCRSGLRPRYVCKRDLVTSAATKTPIATRGAKDAHAAVTEEPAASMPRTFADVSQPIPLCIHVKGTTALKSCRYRFHFSASQDRFPTREAHLNSGDHSCETLLSLHLLLPEAA